VGGGKQSREHGDTCDRSRAERHRGRVEIHTLGKECPGRREGPQGYAKPGEKISSLSLEDRYRDLRRRGLGKRRGGERSEVIRGGNEKGETGVTAAMSEEGKKKRGKTCSENANKITVTKKRQACYTCSKQDVGKEKRRPTECTCPVNGGGRGRRGQPTG